MRQFFLLFSLFCLGVQAQHTNILLGNSYSNNFHHYIYNHPSNLHTSFKPLIKSDVLSHTSDLILDSIYSCKNNKWLFRKIFAEPLIMLNGEGYNVSASPIIHLSLGREFIDNTKTYTNTRGYIIEGDLGQKISFFSSFRENQAVFPSYIHEYVLSNKVVPGQGYAREFKDTGFDYAMSSGYVSIHPSKMFFIQFGHGKHFIGDGYRSLILSDNSFNYPYLRIQTTFWKIKYTNLYTEFQDINYFINHGLDNHDQMGYAKKYMSAHYLSVNITERFNISLFESIIWRMNHAPGSRGFDVNYLNPITLLRPVEFSLNSPDNVLVGINTKFISTDKSYLYGQVILDEFSINDLRANNGFWANKYGYQLGYKIYDLFHFENLTGQIEYNYVRPYTYAHHNPQQNYAHYNQALAHPLGANFSELLFLAKYRLKRWEIDGKIIFAKYGGKKLNEATSYGNDLFESTGNFEEPNGFIYSGRPSDFGIEMYQGNLTKLGYQSIRLGYLLNPHTNLKFQFGVVWRNFKDEERESRTQMITIGMKSDLFNNYYDF